MSDSNPDAHAARPPRRLDPLYRPSGQAGQIVLYAGDIAIATETTKRVVPGELELCLTPSTQLSARFAGPFADLHFLGFDEDHIALSIPSGCSLAPPTESGLPQRPNGVSWVTRRIPLTTLEAGELGQATSFIFHVSGALKVSPRARNTAGGRSQRGLAMHLAGWDLALVPVDSQGDGNFAAVIEAVPSETNASAETLDELGWRLFILLSFVAGREVGVGPICGLARDSTLVWARWSALRSRNGKPGARWCPDALSASALPTLADGFARLSASPATEAVVDRAVNHLLSANGDEVLDVRVPVACSGLEVLSWVVLQHRLKLNRAALKSLNAAGSVRQLLAWAGIPTSIPNGFDALASRRSTVGQADWEGPETLFNVRNKLVHPPNQIDSPEWPSGDELIESWQLATWYLELTILRLLGYEGSFWSRLRLGRMAADVEPVPWHKEDR